MKHTTAGFKHQKFKLKTHVFLAAVNEREFEQNQEPTIQMKYDGVGENVISNFARNLLI